MFRFQLDKFKEAERRIRIQSMRDGHYISLDDDKRLTESTTDWQQAVFWQRILIVQTALAFLGYPPSTNHTLAATNAYAAFAKEVENRA